jgi:Tfp pilus assembly protein PilF
LLRRQPYLLLNISIKKSPDQVQSWLKLTELYEKAGDIDLAYETIEKAIQTINPEKAEGKLSDIWI